MNNKELQIELAKRLDVTQKQSAQWLKLFVNQLVDEVVGGASEVQFASLGSFEIKEKSQRILVNPKTKQRMLVPPKLTLNFKPSNSLKINVKKMNEL